MNENIFHEDSKNNIQFLKDTVATVNEKNLSDISC